MAGLPSYEDLYPHIHGYEHGIDAVTARFGPPGVARPRRGLPFGGRQVEERHFGGDGCSMFAGVVIQWDHDYDMRVLELVENIPYSVRRSLVCVAENDGFVRLLWRQDWQRAAHTRIWALRQTAGTGFEFDGVTDRPYDGFTGHGQFECRRGGYDLWGVQSYGVAEAGLHQDLYAYMLDEPRSPRPNGGR